MGFAVIVGIVVATPIFPFTEEVMIKGLLSFTTAFTFLAAANVVNDYYDRNIDAIDKPTNPMMIMREGLKIWCASGWL